jgi:hypothetical protein
MIEVILNGESRALPRATNSPLIATAMRSHW